MSAPRLISQASNALLEASPNSRLPVLVHLRATIGANGQPTVVADTDATSGDAGTTPGVLLTETGNDTGIYDITFPACRKVLLGTLNINILPDVLATVANHRVAFIDKTDANTAAKLGKIRFTSTEVDAASAVAFIPSGSEVHLSFWADFG